ncbi:MAG: transporter permease [Modestobacter sp.]|jgi:ribose/xylose/arabinose/galactoside ABC-type transport system permease subunit|nr:transporter permease [Modestobacter sp.]
MSTTSAVERNAEREAERLASTAQVRDNVITRWRSRGAFILFALMFAGGCLFVDQFATTGNLVALLQSQAFIGMVAVGMTWVVLSGNFIDLSAPASLAIAANTVLRVSPQSVPLAIVLAIAIPVGLGLVNGYLVGRLKLNPVIATLGTAGIALGLLYLATGGTTSTGSVASLSDVASARPFGVPVPVIAFLLLVLVNQLVLSRFRLGANVRFVGNNPEASRATGIRPVATVAWCFGLSAALAAVAGILLGASTNNAVTGTGAGYEFDALAAIVLGGTLLAGGIGSFWRTLSGVLVVATVNNITLLLGLSAEAQLLVQGIIFVTVVGLDAIATRSRA